LGVTARLKVYIDENKKIIIGDDIWKHIEERLNNNCVPRDEQQSLIKKIEDYFNTLEGRL
jgi:hypothetical protein